MENAVKEMDTRRILPFRFVAASRYAPELEPSLEEAMFRSIKELGTIETEVTVLVDVSGSMDAKLSEKSDLTRIDAAAALAMILREVAQKVNIFAFSQNIAIIPPRHGFALRDSIEQSMPHGSTYLGAAVNHVGNLHPDAMLVVITDEQSHDAVPNPVGTGFMLNVANNINGVGYGPWTHIDGFSESVVRYIMESISAK